MHTDGAVNVPLENIISNGEHYKGMARMDGKNTIYLICTDASKADAAADLLWNYGFKDVRIVAGGLKSWIALGYSLVRNP